MSRALKRNAIISALGDVKDQKQQKQELSFEDQCLALPLEKQKVFCVQQLKALIERKGVASGDASTDAQIAKYYAFHHLDHCIIGSKDDLIKTGVYEAKVDQKTAAVSTLPITVFCDHSGSMSQNPDIEDASYSTMKSVIMDLEQHPEIKATVYTFGDCQYTHCFSSSEYLGLLNSKKIDFEGRMTDFVPAWEFAHRNIMQTDPANRDGIAIIISDGGFTDVDALQKTVLNSSFRLVIFYAPPWSSPNVTMQHAANLGTKISSTALYNGEILPGRIDQLQSVLKRMVPNFELVPDIPGFTKVGTSSIPTLFLKPKFMRMALEQAFTNGNTVFFDRITNLYKGLLESCRMDMIRAFSTSLFEEFMSLNPTMIKFTEARLSDGTCKYRASLASLLKVVTELRNMLSQKYPALKAQLQNDPQKLQQITNLYIRATTVSEREEIIEVHEKNGDVSIGLVEFPNVSAHQMPLLTELFSRIMIMHTGPKTKELDILLTAIFRDIRISPLPTKKQLLSNQYDYEQTFDIPVFMSNKFKLTSADTKKGSDQKDIKGEQKDVKGEQKDVKTNIPEQKNHILSILRLFPTYLRQQQKHHGLQVQPDFTLQPRAAKRLALVLRVYFKCNPSIEVPKWFMRGLESIFIDKSLYDDLEEENITPFWLNVLAVLKEQLPANIQTDINDRRTAWSAKYEALRMMEIKDQQISFEIPVYPNVKPFIEDNPAALIVYQSIQNNNAFLMYETKELIPGARVLTDEKEINAAFQTNLSYLGGYIRPTYLTNGQVILYGSGPDKFEILERQLERSKRYTPMQIKAHLHTVRSLDLLVLTTIDDKKREDKIQQSMKLGKEAKSQTETHSVILTKQDCFAHILKRVEKPWNELLYAWQQYPLTVKDPNHMVGEIDFMLVHWKSQGHSDKNKSVNKHEKETEKENEIKKPHSDPLVPLERTFPIEAMPFINDYFSKLLLKTRERFQENEMDQLTRCFGLEAKSLEALLPKPSAAVSVGMKQKKVDAKDEKIQELLCCPITLERMKQPTIVSPCGHTFEQSSIKMIHDQKGVCPLCNQKIESLAINYSIKDIVTFLS